MNTIALHKLSRARSVTFTWSQPSVHKYTATMRLMLGASRYIHGSSAKRRPAKPPTPPFTNRYVFLVKSQVTTSQVLSPRQRRKLSRFPAAQIHEVDGKYHVVLDEGRKS